MAFGEQTEASGTDSTAFGHSTKASGVASTAFGESTQAGGTNATAFGQSTQANGPVSTTFGNSIIVDGNNTVGIGLDNTPRTVTQDNTMAIMGGKVGIGTIAPSDELHVDGTIRVTGAYKDSTNNAGTAGQVLSSTGTGTDWVDVDTNATNEIQNITSTDGSITVTRTGNDFDLNVSAETTTTVANTIAGHKIADYSNEAGTTVDIDETITTLTATAVTTDLDYDYTSENGTVTTFRSSPIVAFGKVSSTGALSGGYGATVVRNSRGKYTVTFSTARADGDYVIQLTIIDSAGAGNDDYDISYSDQTTTEFVVQTGDNDNGGGDRAQRDSEFMFTVMEI